MNPDGPHPPVESSSGATLVYVAGYGRSGSTLLARLLASAPGVFACGELARLFEGARNGRQCGCGEPLSTCPVWAPVTGHTADEDVPIRTWLMDRLRSRAWTRRRPGATDRSSTIELIARSAGARILVDTSKTSLAMAFRPIRLANAGVDIRLIHLVRDGRGVMWSKLKAKQRSTGGALTSFDRLRTVGRAALSWNAANAAAWWAARRIPGEAYILTYEALVRDPLGVIPLVYEWLGPVLDAPVTPDTTRSANHLLGGNRMRMVPVGDIVLDDAWRTHLTTSELRLFWTLSWPWMLWHRRRVRDNLAMSAD